MTERSNNAGSPGRWWLPMLVLVGVAIRVLGAWLYRHSYNPDYGIVGLMAKHMAEGSDFPVFFYGQSYMGSLEPAVSALLCRGFGISGFMVCLGTALFGMALISVVYAWGRDMGGRVAGAAAALFCVVGPDGYFHYQGSPRGGYGVTLLVGTFLMWQACRMGRCERLGKRVPSLRYFLMGVLAGLGIWSNFLIAPALATAGLMVIALAGVRSIVSRRALYGMAGVGLGGLPLWLWNLRHAGESFDMARSFGSLGQQFAHGQRLFWLVRLPDLLDFPDGSVIGQAGLAVAYALVAGVAVWSLWRGRRASAGRREGSAKSGQAGMPVLYTLREPALLICALAYLVVFAVVFSLSGFSAFNTPRYLLPIVPILGVLVGGATAVLVGDARRSWSSRGAVWRGVLGWMPLYVLMAWQLSTVSRHFVRESRYEGAVQQAARLADRLRSHDLEAVYTPYLLHALNFLLNEDFIFADIKGERYPPYARAAEEAEAVAVLNGYGGISEFVQATRGDVVYERLGLFRLYRDLTPPQESKRPVPADQLAGVVDSSGRNVRELVIDGNLDTAAVCDAPAGQEEWIEVQFVKPVRLGSLRLLSDMPRIPKGWRIEGLHRGRWTVLMGGLTTSYYFWSGPRPYWAGDQFRLESGFEPTVVEAVRIGFLRDSAWGAFRISELGLFETSTEPVVPEATALPELIAVMSERHTQRLWADRWVANRVHAATGGAVAVNREPSIYDDGDADVDPSEIEFGPNIAVLVKAFDTEMTRRCLAARGIVMRETAVGPWTLFDFGPGNWQEAYRGVPGLLFRGGTCVIGNGKHWAVWQVHRADDAAADGKAGRAEAIGLLNDALRACPDYTPAMTRLAELFEESGQQEGAERLWKRVSEMTLPKTPALIDFDRGIRFLGLSVDSDAARAGDSFGLRYFWVCPPEVNPARLAVFVHIVGPGGVRFQDDHILLDGMDPSFQPLSEVFTEVRRVPIPTGIAPGEYRVWLGLYQTAPPRRRWQPQTDLTHLKRAVEIPITLHVTEH